MKVGKIILSIFLLLAIFVGGAVWYALSNLNSLVKDIIVVTGSDALNTHVTVETVDIKLLDGSAALGGFTIKNYPGFTQMNLVVVDAVKVDIDPRSLSEKTIVIEELLISGVAIVAEQKGTTTNLQTLLKALPKSDSSSSPEEGDSSTPEILLAVERLTFVDNKLSLATEDYGTHSLDLPRIERTNLGSREQGLTPEQLATEIVKPLIEAAKKRAEKGVRDLAKAEMEEKYGEQIEKEKAKLKDKLEGLLGEGAEEKLKGLKDLF